MKLPKSFGKPKRSFRAPFAIRRVSGNSMLPYLKPGQLVLARQWFTKPKEGQIVIIQHNGLDKIKRIKEFKADKIYVVGDNPKQSTDSRDFGWLPRETIIAKVLASL